MGFRDGLCEQSFCAAQERPHSRAGCPPFLISLSLSGDEVKEDGGGGGGFSLLLVLTAQAC